MGFDLRELRTNAVAAKPTMERRIPCIQGSALQSGFLSKSDSIVGMEG